MFLVVPIEIPSLAVLPIPIQPDGNSPISAVRAENQQYDCNKSHQNARFTCSGVLSKKRISYVTANVGSKVSRGS